MDIGKLNQSYNTAEYWNDVKEAVNNILRENPELLEEFEVKYSDAILLVKKELSLIFYHENYNQNVIRYSCSLTTEETKNKGMFYYLIDLDGNYIDEFLVIE